MTTALLRHDREPKPVTDGDRMVYEIAAAIDMRNAQRDEQRDYHPFREILPWAR